MADMSREVLDKMNQFNSRMNASSHKIVTCSRGLVPVLQDAGRPNSAKELEVLLFELDVIIQEAADFVRVNFEAIVENLINRQCQGGDG